MASTAAKRPRFSPPHTTQSAPPLSDSSAPAPAPTTTPSTRPRRLEDYVLHRVVGSGGSATVIRASPRADPTASVALKALAKRGLSRRAQRYLAREIAVHRAVAAHPHIVALHDAFENRDGIYLVMEHLRGGDLYSLLRRERRPLRARTALHVLAQVCDALAYTHARGVSHRDLKLENIMFARPLVRASAGPGYDPASVDVQLVDFGLACARDPSAPDDMRLSRESCGTKNYCAPEVLRARHRPYQPEHADIWSAGVVLYAMLTRRLPFAADTLDPGAAAGTSAVPSDPHAAAAAAPLPRPDDAVTQERVDRQFEAPELRRLPKRVVLLLRSLLTLDPAARPTAADALDTIHRLLADRDAMRSSAALSGLAAAALAGATASSGGGGADAGTGATSGSPDAGMGTSSGGDAGAPAGAAGRGSVVLDAMSSEVSDPDKSPGCVGSGNGGARGGEHIGGSGDQAAPANNRIGGDGFNLGFLKGVFDLFSRGNDVSPTTAADNGAASRQPTEVTDEGEQRSCSSELESALGGGSHVNHQSGCDSSGSLDHS